MSRDFTAPVQTTALRREPPAPAQIAERVNEHGTIRTSFAVGGKDAVSPAEGASQEQAAKRNQRLKSTIRRPEAMPSYKLGDDVPAGYELVRGDHASFLRKKAQPTPPPNTRLLVKEQILDAIGAEEIINKSELEIFTKCATEHATLHQLLVDSCGSKTLSEEVHRRHKEALEKTRSGELVADDHESMERAMAALEARARRVKLLQIENHNVWQPVAVEIAKRINAACEKRAEELLAEEQDEHAEGPGRYGLQFAPSSTLLKLSELAKAKFAPPKGISGSSPRAFLDQFGIEL